jgi:tetratricopeptide (TPR) repeat protein
MRRPIPLEAWLGLACLLAFATTGCQSVSRKVNPKALDNASQAQNPDGEKPAELGPLKAKQKVGVHIDLGRAFEVQGNFEAALAEYQKATEEADLTGGHFGSGREVKQYKALAERRMGGALDRLGRFAQAELHYQKALEVAPNDVNIWNDCGYSYYLQKRWADAERCLLTAAKLDPNNQRVQTNLGLTLAAAGKTDQALGALTRAANPAAAHANLGYILAATGNTEEARKHYQTALEIQPQFDAARFALAKLEDGGLPQANGASPLPAPLQTARAAAGRPSNTASVTVPDSVTGMAAAPPPPTVTAAPIVAPAPISVVSAGGSASSVPSSAAQAQPSPWVPPAPSASASTLASPSDVASRRPAGSVPVVSGVAPAGSIAPGDGPKQIVPSAPTPARSLASTGRTLPQPIPPPASLPRPSGSPRLATASNITGIPLPTAPRASTSDLSLSRASTDTGIPLPQPPTPATQAPTQ